MSETYKQQYIYLGIALAGVYARSPSVISGNSKTTSSTEIPDKRLTPYLGELKEGGYVVDKRSCNEKDVIHNVCAGAMLDIDLPEKTRKDWDKEYPCDDASSSGSMDYISMDLYLKLWEGLGARVGRRAGNVIKWNNGEETVIPEFDCRWQWDAWVK
jgi:hypothetical protein